MPPVPDDEGPCAMPAHCRAFPKPNRDETYRAFLATPRTVPSRDRDFFEWHNGISHYGFWAVVIEDRNWIRLCDAAHAQVKRFVHPGYQRAPHITITACGLFHQHHFSAEQLERQRTALRETRIPPFYLEAGPLNSLPTAPCLMIGDPTGAIGQIRDRLTVISREDAPGHYQPHITLGLYRDAFDTAEVADCLAGFEYAPVEPMLVTELVFCVYETKEIQGRLGIMERVKLNGARHWTDPARTL